MPNRAQPCYRDMKNAHMGLFGVLFLSFLAVVVSPNMTEVFPLTLRSNVSSSDETITIWRCTPQVPVDIREMTKGYHEVVSNVRRRFHGTSCSDACNFFVDLQVRYFVLCNCN